MSLGSRWRRVDAEHWVYRLGMLQTTLLALATAWILLTGFIVGMVVALLPGAFAGLFGWLTAAWRRDQPWSWPAWVCVSGLGAVTTAVPLVAGELTWVNCSGFVIATVTLVLLFHPDSRARWLARPAAAALPLTRSRDDTLPGAGGRPALRS